ncbi:MAG TPA: dephospho-CoA kinase, partial [Chlamydiales bacterium]|nr:dephospho-CoA kinase [Chlamydiales bacterium]
MLELKKIAITGGLASGKSTVCQFFQELGACVINADTIVHEILE